MTASVANAVYPVPKGWRLRTADEIRSPEPHSCVAGPFGSKISSKYFVDDGVPVIRGSNLRDDLTRFVPEGFVFVSDARAQEYRPQHVRGGDLVFTCWGTIGQVGLVPEDGPYPEYIISNKQLKLRVDPATADPRFCFYYFASPRYVEYIRNRGIGGAVPGINLGILKSLLIAVPPIAVQTRIADILSAYDNLIENNRRRMALLEESARQLYREWFVRLRFPGHEHTPITNGVPRGWESGAIADFFDTTSGGTPSRANPDFYTGDINWVKTQELNDDYIFETEERITEDALARSSAKLFPVDTLLVSIYGGSNIGRTGVLAEPAATNQACCALFPMEPRAHYIYGALYFREQREHLIALAQGAAQTNISQQVIRSLPMMMPTPTLMTAFIESLSPTFEQMKVLKRQREKLRAARDLLLPRLMRGEIEV